VLSSLVVYTRTISLLQISQVVKLFLGHTGSFSRQLLINYLNLCMVSVVDG